MLIKYYFKIQYTKGTKNARVNALSRKVELQNNKKLLGALLRKNKDILIRYNYPKIIVIKEEKIYKTLENIQL